MTVWISPSQPGDWWTDAEVEDGYAPSDIRPLGWNEPGAEDIFDAEEQWQHIRAGEHIRGAFDRE